MIARTKRIMETLFELAGWHKSKPLETIATRLRNDFVNKGQELTPKEEKDVITEAANTFKREKPNA